MFPDSSVTVQVTVVVPNSKSTPDNEFAPEAIVAPVNSYSIVAIPQLSVAVISQSVFASKVQTPASATTSGSTLVQPAIIGAWSSATVTSNSHVEMFPAISVTVQVTVVVPNSKSTPDKLFEPLAVVAPVNSYSIDATPQLSVAVISQSVFASKVQTPASATTSGSTLVQPAIIGAWSSATVTSNSHVEMFPAISVTVQVTVVVPNSKSTPDKLFEPLAVVAPVNSYSIDDTTHFPAAVISQSVFASKVQTPVSATTSGSTLVQPAIIGA